FGGVARMTKDSDSAKTEFKIAVAGPLVSLLIAVAAGAAGIAAAGGADRFWEAMTLEDDAGVSGPVAVLASLTSVNVAVLLFNLLPAFPLDGGRIARAIAWGVSGNRNRATKFAAVIGQGF